MLSAEDYTEACRRYKDKRTKFHERQRYHALILVTQGYTHEEVSRILLLTEEAIRQWVSRYESHGLEGLQNHPNWGGEHGQRCLNTEQLAELQQILQHEAMPGTQVGSGWTGKAIRQEIRERFGVSYSKSGVRKLFHRMGWSYQRGRKLSAPSTRGTRTVCLGDGRNLGAVRRQWGARRAVGRGSKQGVFGRDAGPTLESDRTTTPCSGWGPQ